MIDCYSLKMYMDMRKQVAIKLVLDWVEQNVIDVAIHNNTSYTVIGLRHIDTYSKYPDILTRKRKQLPSIYSYDILSDSDKEAYLLGFQHHFKDCDVRWTPEGLRISWDLIPSDKT